MTDELRKLMKNLFKPQPPAPPAKPALRLHFERGDSLEVVVKVLEQWCKDRCEQGWTVLRFDDVFQPAVVVTFDYTGDYLLAKPTWITTPFAVYQALYEKRDTLNGLIRFAS